MNTIGVRHLRECFLEVVHGFSVVALRHSYLAEPVVSCRVVFIDRQCGAEARAGIFQTIQFEEDVSQVYESGDVVRTQCARELVATYGVVETTFLMIQLSEEIDPTKVFRGKPVGVQPSIARCGEE